MKVLSKVVCIILQFSGRWIKCVILKLYKTFLRTNSTCSCVLIYISKNKIKFMLFFMCFTLLLKPKFTIDNLIRSMDRGGSLTNKNLKSKHFKINFFWNSSYQSYAISCFDFYAGVVTSDDLFGKSLESHEISNLILTWVCVYFRACCAHFINFIKGGLGLSYNVRVVGSSRVPS